MLRHALLVALLAALYMVLWLEPDTLMGRTFAIVHLGLFLVWQPFMQADRRLSARFLLGLAGILVVAGLYLNAFAVALWIMMLAGIVGGKVLLFGARAPRLFYLLALGFLVSSLVLIAVPLAVPIARLPEPIGKLAYAGLPLILVVMLLLGHRQERENDGFMVDFVYSLFLFLLLAVLILGSLALMLLVDAGYVEALLETLTVTAAVLLMLGLAWNPHAGFAGLGGLISRYLMSIGLPVEQWLQALTNLAAQEDNPKLFLEKACAEMTRLLPWVTGVEWTTGNSSGRFGETLGRRWEFKERDLVLVFHTQQTLAPTLVWHCNLLATLLSQFHADKVRALALKQLSYMQAIHETGARLTHDLKNLLQSLNALCSAGNDSGAVSSPAYQALLQRQLPAITERLADTLSKFNVPQAPSVALPVAAADWWQELGQRLAALTWVRLAARGPLAGELPAEVFSGIVDNLMRNAAEKRLREPELTVELELLDEHGGFSLTVSDDGSGIPEDIADGLFLGPVDSESGYGIGLYNAARFALQQGYRLELAENRAGRVCFRLAPAP